MSEAITIFNGGEAPHAARSISGTAIVGGDQGGVMQQNGGPAPEPGAGGQPAAPADTQLQEIIGGDPPLGGAVHAR
jgi:hypothetical protein